MKFSGKLLTSTNRMNAAFVRAQGAINNPVKEAIAEGILAIHAEAVRGVMKRSEGERQTRYSPRREVVASKPGDPPNVDTGVFVKSIQFEMDWEKGAGYVGTNDKRGPAFEFGTKNMAARPWLTPAYVKAQKKIVKLFKNMKFKINKAG